MAARFVVWHALLTLVVRRGAIFPSATPRLLTALDLFLAGQTSPAEWQQSSPDTESLEAFVGRAVEHVRNAGRVHFTGSDSALADFDQALGVQQRRISCAACCEVGRLPADKICRGGEYTDLDALDRGGLCLKELRDLFAECRTLASAWHKVPWPKEPVLDLVIHWADPVGGFGEYFVDGVTRRDEHGITIELRLNHQRFDLSSYLALLYVLLHELVAHGFVPPQHGNPTPESQFDEGWMDYVVSLLIEALDRNDPRLVPSGSGIGHLRRRLDAAKRYHLERHDVLGRQADRNTRSRAYGRKLACLTLDLFRRLSAAPEADFVRFSLELNRAPIDWREKDRFVNALALMLPPGGALTPWDNFEGQHLVVEYLRHRDLGRFMNDVRRNVTSGV